MTIRKIGNLKLIESEDKKIKNLNEVKSLRNRMLQNSDYVFIEDINLSPESISQWKLWRTKVRNVDLTDLELAVSTLKELDLDKPDNHYKNQLEITLEEYREVLHMMLASIIEKTIKDFSLDYGTRDIIIEKFDEAVKFLSGDTENCPFIELEANLSNGTKESIAEEFLELRKNYLIKLLNIERSRKTYSLRISNVDNISQCDTLKGELRMLGLKKWI